jgi:hypothetical protein
MLVACFWGETPMNALYPSLILLGLGTGMIDIPLLVTAQAGCLRRGDVATATGFSLTLKALARFLGRAAGHAMQGYYEPVGTIDIFRPVEYGRGEGDPAKAAWGNLVIASNVGFAIAFATVVVCVQNARHPPL